MSVKVILRSPEAIKLFLAKYFDGKEFKLDVTGEVTLEQEETDIAVDVFKLLLKENLVSAEHVEFLNITPNSTTTEIEVQETSQEKQNSGASRGKERKTKSTKEMVFDFLCEISPKKATTTEISENLQIGYQSVSSALCRLYKEGKVDKDKKKYFKKQNSEEVVKEVVTGDMQQTTEANGQEEEEQQTTRDEPIAEDTGNQAEANATKSEGAKTKEEGAPKENVSKPEEVPVTQYTPLEKAKTMVEVFSNARYTEVLYYIFFKRKGNFEVEKIRASLGERESENISKIINILNEKGIISFNEKLPKDGRYEIEPIWRIYANLIRYVEPMEEGAIRTAVELGDKEFQKIMKQALADEIVERTDIKRVTRYAVAANLMA